MTPAARRHMRERALRGLQAQLQTALNYGQNGSTVEIKIGTAKALVAVLEQVRSYELENTAPEERT